MNPLRQQMDADMIVRRMSERTREAYLFLSTAQEASSKANA